MKRECIKAMLPILQAFADGKVIQMLDNRSIWTDLTEREGLPIGTLREEPNSFRIKPEQKYRPFANVEECWQELLKHQPFGWIYDGGYRSSIVSICDTTVDIINISTNDIMECLFSEMIEEGYTFSDGTPFGIKEEE